MANPSPAVETPVAKRTVRYVSATMTPEVRAAAGLRHTETLRKWRVVKLAKKDAMADFKGKLDTLDLQALSLETATKAKDGEDVSLPMVCKEVPIYREERRSWMLAVYKIDEDAISGAETEVFERWEDLPEELAHLNQGSLPFDGKPPPGGGGGDGAAPGKPDHDPLRDVDFPPDEDGDGKNGEAEPPKPAQPGEEKPKGGRGKKKGTKK